MIYDQLQMNYLCVIVTLYYWIWSRAYPHLPQDFKCFYFIKLGPFPDTVHWSCRSTVDVRSTSGRCPSYRSRRAQTSHTNSNFANREEKGIIVANAKQELLDWHNKNPNKNRYLAKTKFAAAIEEGLQYFGFLVE